VGSWTEVSLFDYGNHLDDLREIFNENSSLGSVGALSHGPWGNIIGIGYIVRLCRVKSTLFFSITERRSLPHALKNEEDVVRGAAGTMDPLTPNRVAFPGLAGLTCRS